MHQIPSETRLILTVETVIKFSFYLLFLTVPLFFCTANTAPFDFNKILIVYGFTAVIYGSWLTKSILIGEIRFYPTPLDLPILFFVIILSLSTIFSTYVPLSLWGKGSMPVGALAPTLSFLLLYYAFINLMRENRSILFSLYALLSSGFIAALYGILQYYGMDFIPWGEQWQARSFGTIGQANGLAAFLGALSLLTIYFYTKTNSFSIKLLHGTLWFLFIFCILTTASRSGLLGLGVATLFFFFWTIWYSRRQKQLRSFFNTVFVFAGLGTAAFLIYLTPGLIPKEKTFLPAALQYESLASAGNARYLVWQGAVTVWKKYPLLGSGPETFGDQYNLVRSKEQNVAAGWNLFWVKAHNEYLQVLATTGTVGFLAYMILLITFLGWANVHIYRFITGDKFLIDVLLPIALISGYIHILITNIFGFSWVPIATLFYLIPALVINSCDSLKENKAQPVIFSFPTSSGGKKWMPIALSVLVLLTFVIEFRIWNADFVYNQGQKELSGDFIRAEKLLKQAIQLNPFEANYYSDLALAYAYISVGMKQKYNDLGTSKEYKNLAIAESNRAVGLYPQSLDIWRKKAQVFYILQPTYPTLYAEAHNAMRQAIKLSPNDARTYYLFALIQEAFNHQDQAIQSLIESINLKSDYFESHYSLTLLYYKSHELPKARMELQNLLQLRAPEQEELEILIREAEKSGDQNSVMRLKQYKAKI